MLLAGVVIMQAAASSAMGLESFLQPVTNDFRHPLVFEAVSNPVSEPHGTLLGFRPVSRPVPRVSCVHHGDLVSDLGFRSGFRLVANRLNPGPGLSTPKKSYAIYIHFHTNPVESH